MEALAGIEDARDLGGGRAKPPFHYGNRQQWILHDPTIRSGHVCACLDVLHMSNAARQLIHTLQPGQPPILLRPFSNHEWNNAKQTKERAKVVYSKMVP